MARFSGYLGTYTEGKSRGIYYFCVNGESGVVECIRPAAEEQNPSFLAFSPSGEFLYAVNELDEYGGVPGGAVAAYAVREDGTLKFLNRKGSGGAGPCHLCVDREGRFVVTANYSGGSLAALPVGKGGRLGEAVQVIRYEGAGPDAKRQERAHAHSFTFAPDFSGGFACDLGADRVLLYDFKPGARKPLVPRAPSFVSAPPGYGPRHGVFHPSGRFAYVLHELGSAVDVFAVGDGASGNSSGGGLEGGPGRGLERGGGFRRLQTISTLPEKGNRKPSSAAAIRMAPGGKFLYASNRGHDSIAVFRVLPGGLLDLADITDSGGQHPRDFIPDPKGNFLLVLNKDSDNLVIFKIDRRTGLLKQEREYAVPSPTGIVIR
jgi:6-phosphogluconolactonase